MSVQHHYAERRVAIEDCDFISSVHGQLSTHIRQMHLGAAVVCYVCDKHWWSASTWLNYIEKAHPDLGEDNYFVHEGSTAEELHAALVIKQEITDADL